MDDEYQQDDVQQEDDLRHVLAVHEHADVNRQHHERRVVRQRQDRQQAKLAHLIGVDTLKREQPQDRHPGEDRERDDQVPPQPDPLACAGVKAPLDCRRNRADRR